GTHLRPGPGFDLDVDEGRLAVAGGERDFGEEVELAPTAPRPIGESLLVQELPVRQVEAPGRLGCHKGKNVGEEAPDQVLEDLVVAAPAPPGRAWNVKHTPIEDGKRVSNLTNF
ncbi:MAG: hypothetical protein ABUL63_01950, partial [Acidobacteriota bacterium]